MWNGNRTDSCGYKQKDWNRVELESFKTFPFRLLQVNGKDKEIKNADGAIEEISFSLKQKSGPLQVALSRQNQRGLRPGIELCNDKAQHALHQELMMLKGTFLSL